MNHKGEVVTLGKRLLSLFLALAMVVTMFQMQGMEQVFAAESENEGVKLYFELPEGTSATDWCVNVWSKAKVTEGDTEHSFKPSTWEDGNYPALLTNPEKSKWGYVVISGAIEGLQFVKKDGTEYKCWNAEIAKQNHKEAYFAPTDKKWYTTEDKTTEIKAAEIRNIFILAGDSGLAGSSWEPKDEKNTLTQNEGNKNKYSITYRNVAAGTYSYKILQDPENAGWDKKWGYGTGSDGNRSVTVAAPADVTLTIDLTDTTPNKTVDVKCKYLQKLVADNGNITAGKPKELATSAKYYDGSGNEAETVTVSYQLKEAQDGVSLTNNTITVAKNSGLTEVTVVAEYNGFQQEMTIPVVAKQYKVTINVYSPDMEMQPRGSDVYIFEKGGNTNKVVTLDKTVEDSDNHITWVQGTTELSFNNLGIIARYKAGSWDDGKDMDKFFTIDENASEIILWYVVGKTPVTTKPKVTVADPRYLYLEYENPDLGDTIPQFYSWTTGINNKRELPFTSVGDGKWKIKAQVSASCTKVDFVVVLDDSGKDWVKDGGNHTVVFPENQNVVYASIKKGEEPKLSAPYNKGYEVDVKAGKIHFYYRDDQALLAGNLDKQKVSVEIDGAFHEMKYNEKNLRFEYACDIKNGRTDYRYKVGEAFVTDKYNDKKEPKDQKEYSYVEYYKLNASVQAEVVKPSFNYNENNVVKFEIIQKKANTSEPTLQVAEASIDVSSLGGSKALAIVPDLKAVTISVTQDTPLGTKTLPITVKDQYGNLYTTSVQVEIAARTKKDAKDFDWDESVIYFMVTDRFFDGNASNNTANGEKTYGTNEGLYHGGDFAGVTQKLDYLEQLGINTIWITPIVKNIKGVTVTDKGADKVPYNAAYHGYWASDFTKLNPALGTEEEFKTLIEQAHERGIRIMVDIVVNHAGYGTESTFGDKLRSGDDVVAGSDQKDSLSNLPDFKTEDPAVSAQLVKWQTQWVKDYGIDYFRVDTVKHVENDTWSELKNALTEAKPSFKMIGEYSGGGYASNGNTLGTGTMDSDLDFDFNDQANSFVNGNIKAVESFLAARNAALNNTYMTGQFLGSHDEDGFKQKLLDAGVSKDAADAMALVAATLQITAKGQPVIYYGEEIGLTGLNNYPYQTNRYDFDWSKANDSNKTYSHYKKLLSIRNAYTDVFARGTRQMVVSDDKEKYDVAAREYQGTKLYVGMNVNTEELQLTIPVTEGNASVMTDLYSGKTYVVNGGKVTVTIPSAEDGGTVILKRTGSVSSGSSSASTSEPKKDQTTEVKKDTIVSADGSKTEVTMTTQKNEDGTVSGVTAEVQTTGKESKKKVTGTISSEVVEHISDAAKTKDVDVVVTVVAGEKSFVVKAEAQNLTAGTKLKAMAIDTKTNKYVLVDSKTIKVDKDGNVKVSLPAGKTYQLMPVEEAEQIEKEILKTVQAKKPVVEVKKGKKAKVQFSSKLDMNNVAKITYKSEKKSVAKVDAKGNVIAKKKGTAVIKAVVTLVNGKKKVIKIKMKVK
mgnify:CR=1 FL=1